MNTLLRIVFTLWMLMAMTIGHMALLIHVAHLPAAQAFFYSLFASLVIYGSLILLTPES